MATQRAREVVNYFPPAFRRGGVYIGHPLDTRGFDTMRMSVVAGTPVAGAPSERGITVNVSAVESDGMEAGTFRHFMDANPVDYRANGAGDLSWSAHRLGPAAGRKRYMRWVLEIIGSGLLPCALLVELIGSRERRPGPAAPDRIRGAERLL